MSELLKERRNKIKTYKGKVGQQVPRELMSLWIISTYLKTVPLKAILEIMEWNEIFKSPYSFSFYSKSKDWNDATDGTIRISDHWNFRAHGGIHCRTIQEGINQNCWAKGIAKDGVFDIVEIYSANEYKDYNEYRQTLLVNKKQHFLDMGGDSVIQFGKEFSKCVNEGRVVFKGKYIDAKITKWKMSGDKPQIRVDLNGLTVKIKNPVVFSVMIDNTVYTSSQICDRLGIYR